MKYRRNITEWTSFINGKEYKFFFEKFNRNKKILRVNNEEIFMQESFFTNLFGLEQKIIFDGLEGFLVIEKDDLDIAYNGIYLRSQEEFIPHPKWAVVFVVLCMLLPVVSLGGALPVVMGMGGAYLCLKVSKSHLSNIAKLISCTVITVLDWILCFIIIVLISMII